MDQPTVTIRRHNSLPARVRISSPSLKRMSEQMKFNPYVGWFRHSPDTSSENKCSAAPGRVPKFLRHNAPSCSLMALKAMPFQDSPYASFFRQLPAKAGARGMFKEMQDEFLTLVEVTRSIAVTQDHVQELADFLAGRLRGGSPYYSSANDSYKGRTTLTTYYPYSAQSPSAAASRFLTRIASWVLAPFLMEDEDSDKRPKVDHRDSRSSSHSSLKSLDNESLTTVGPEDTGHEEDDDDDDCTEYSNYSGHYQEPTATNYMVDFVNPREGYLRSSSLGGESTMAARDAVSSQAEAYYAHQAARDLNPDEVIPSRLDYVITQMDIIRMQRNASRHLDVESICQLHTITYLKNHATKLAAPIGNTQEQQQDESWMLVSNSAEDQGTGENPPGTDDETDVCVICLEHFVYGDRLRVLPCNHSFHMGCIDRWLSGSSSFDECHTAGCPTCKKRPAMPDEQRQQQPSTPFPPEEEEMLRPDGSVPSWAFCQLGSALLARDSQQS